MSYLSDVALVLRKEVFDEMEAKRQEKGIGVAFDGYELIDQAGNTDGVNPVYVILKAKGVKWYKNDPDYFPEVRFVMDFLQRDDISYHFIEIGEELNDIDVREQVVDEDEDIVSFIYVKRSIGQNRFNPRF